MRKSYLLTSYKIYTLILFVFSLFFLFGNKNVKAQACLNLVQPQCRSVETFYYNEGYCGSGINCVKPAADCHFCSGGCSGGTLWTCNSCTDAPDAASCDPAYACSGVDSCICITRGSCGWYEPPPPGGGGGGGGGTSCTAYSWVDQACGESGCAAGERHQTRTVSPAGCQTTDRCVADSTCTVEPLGCTATPWVNNGCGLGGCSSSLMLQSRDVTDGCGLDSTQCIPDASCVSSVSCDIDFSTPTLTLSGTSTSSPYAVNTTTPPVGGTIVSMSFVSDAPSVVSVVAADAASPWGTTVTPVNTGTANVYATATMSDGETTCSAVGQVSVDNPAPWWQVDGGGDAITRGNLVSSVPATTDFSLDGPGGFPGIPIFSGSNLTGANTSSRGWRADSPVNISSTENYEYAYYEDRLPSTVVPTAGAVNLLTSGTAVGSGTNTYYVIVYTGGNLVIPANVDLLNRKVLLYVQNGDLDINGRINLNDGVGFFMAIVNGDINVNPSVGGGTPDLEGIYYAQNQFYTGSNNTTPASDQKLSIRGTVIGIASVAGDGVVLERDLSNNTAIPAESFVFAADQLMMFPPFLGKRNVRWVEVAP